MTGRAGNDKGTVRSEIRWRWQKHCINYCCCYYFYHHHHVNKPRGCTRLRAPVFKAVEVTSTAAHAADVSQGRRCRLGRGNKGCIQGPVPYGKGTECSRARQVNLSYVCVPPPRYRYGLVAARTSPCPPPLILFCLLFPFIQVSLKFMIILSYSYFTSRLRTPSVSDCWGLIA